MGDNITINTIKERKYKIDMLQYSQSGSVASNCADITFYNGGVANVTINNAITLYTGQSVGFSANNDELDTTNYFFNFQATGTVCQLIVLRKTYV